MTISFSTLITGFSKFIEAVPVISVADAGSNATKIVDTALSIYGDGYFNDWWIYVTSGLASGDIRQIETHTKATTTLDPYVDFSSAVANGDTYEIHKHNPDLTKRSINDALVSIYPKLYKEIAFEDLGHSLLTANAALGQKNVLVSDATLFFVGQVLTLKDNTPQSEDVTIASITPATNTLTMVANLTKNYTTAQKAKVIAKSGQYFNVGRTLGNNRITGLFVRADNTSQRKRYVEFEVITDDVNGRQIYFPSSISVDSQNWIVEARGRLEEVSAPADLVTIEDERVKLLYAQSAYHLYDRQASEVSAGDYRRLMALALKYREMVNTDLRHLWMPQPREYASIKTDRNYD